MLNKIYNAEKTLVDMVTGLVNSLRSEKVLTFDEVSDKIYQHDQCWGYYCDSINEEYRKEVLEYERFRETVSEVFENDNELSMFLSVPYFGYKEFEYSGKHN